MTWESIQYPARAEPAGDPSGFVEPVFFDGWFPPISQPVLPAEQRYLTQSTFYQGEPDDFGVAFNTFGWERQTHQPVIGLPDQRHEFPSTFVQIEPDDFVEPVFFDGWNQPASQPVRPIEYRFTLPSWFYQGEPGDFEVFDTFGWEQPTNQFVIRRVEDRYLMRFMFAPDYEEIISSDSDVFFEAWVQPIGQPVLPVEYRYWMPSTFFEIEPADFTIPSVFIPAFTIRDTLDVICSKISASGYVESCELGQAKQLDIGNSIGVNVWIETRSIALSSLTKSTTVYGIMARFHKNMLSEPTEQIEFRLAEAISEVAEDLLGDFDLGSTVRNIDVAGEVGQPMGARWGYAGVGGTMYRVADLFIPLIVNDTSTFVK